MTPRKTLASPPPATRSPTPVFTVARANRALVLVRKIIADMQKQYTELAKRRRERDKLLQSAVEPERLQELNIEIAAAATKLEHLSRELQAVGAVLKDLRTGLVDFPSVYRGRQVWLCWRAGEAEVTHWHELDDGAAGRKPIGEEQFG